MSRERAFWFNGRPTTAANVRPGDVVRTEEAVYVCVDEEPMIEVRRRAQLIARSPLTVLILGETGTGKEVLARTIHHHSGRAGEFVAVNCAAIPRELLAAELFGHVRGAFSGAVRTRKGWVASADNGTLLLDEIGEMPAECQPSLLRLVENHAVTPLGSDRERIVDVRIVAATNRELNHSGISTLRPDLYARLAQVVLRIPPLRERQTEVLTLAQEIADAQGSRLCLELDAAEALLRYPWPHNVRELKSVVTALGVFAQGAPKITLEHLAEVNPAMLDWSCSGKEEPRRRLEPSGITRLYGHSSTVLRDPDTLKGELLRANGNIAELARQLRTSRTHVYRWLRHWDLLTK